MRFSALDGWRGIAAIFVALYHLEFYNHIQDSAFLRNSYLFVDFFFILSGFVISHAYTDRLKNLLQIKEFIILRVARLWPLHLFVLALFVLLEIVKLVLFQIGGWGADVPPFTNQFSSYSLFTNIFLLQSLNIHNSLSWNFPSWSISVELYTYVVFAVVIGISNKYKILLKYSYFLVIVMSLIILFFSVESINDATYKNGVFRCFIGFFLGSICYQLYTRVTNIKIPAATIVEAFLVLAIIAFIVLAGSNKYSLLAPVVFSVAIFFFAFEQGFISKLLKNKYIQNLGVWSYSIYMLHAFIVLLIGRSINVFEQIMNDSYTVQHVINESENIELFYILNLYVMDVLTFFYIVFLIFIASLSYRYIEVKGAKLRGLEMPWSYHYGRVR